MVMLRRYQSNNGSWTNLYLLDGTLESESRFAMVCDKDALLLPDVIEFSDTWNDPSLGPAHYIFYPMTLGDQIVQRGDAIWDLIKPPSPFPLPRTKRIHWMRRVDGTEVDLEIDNADQITAFSISIGRYLLEIPDLTQLAIVDRGFLFDSSATGASTSFGITRPTRVSSSHSEILLEIADTRGQGVSRFVVPFELTGRNSSNSHLATDFDSLDIGLRYFRTQSTNGTSLRFSVFQTVDDQSRAACTGYFDKYHFMKPATPGLEDSFIEWSPNTRLGSHFRTSSGCELVLSPVATSGHESRLVFTPRRTTAIPSPVTSNSVYLCPSGDFHIVDVRHSDGSPTSASRHRLTCGKSGIEEITFAAGDIIRFEPYRSAHFDVANDAPITPVPPSRLTPDAETSWARIIPANSTDTPAYLAQPDDAPLYSPDPTNIYSSNAHVTRTNGLEIFQFQLIPLKAIEVDELHALPVVPSDGFRPTVGGRNSGILNERSDDRKGKFLAPKQPGVLTKFDLLELKWSDGVTTFEQTDVAVTGVTIIGSDQEVSFTLPEYSSLILPPFQTRIFYRITPSSQYINLEAKVLEPERRRILFPRNRSVAGNRPLTGRLQDTVTPQGLLVKADVDNQLRFDVLRLGKSQPKADAPDGEFIEFGGVWKSDAFSEGLRRNQLFAVFSGVPKGDDPGIGDPTFDKNILNILGWLFTLKFDQSLPDTYPRPLLILKYYDGKTLAELVEDRSVWAAGLFQDRDQQTLRDFVQEVRGMRINDPKHYENIYRKIEDPNWSGVLAINIALDCKNLPDALKGIAIGIDLNQFRAQHVGVNASRYESGNGGMSVDIVKSSLFGLIDYRPRNPGPAGGGGGAFEFTLTKLQVLFEQSAIRSFGAEIEFATKKAFKESSTGDDKVVVKGSYQQKNGIDTYSFVCSEKKVITLVNTASSANPFIDKLSIYRVEMVTEAGAESGGLTPVTARFIVNGAVDLGQIFDNYLCLTDAAFQNMTAEFKFDIDRDGRPRNFHSPSFEPGLISFDLSKAQKCAKSLLSFLPLDLKRFYFAAGSTQANIATLGFLPLTTTGGASPGSSNDGSWFDYALSFSLDLGSLGALAKPFKDFKAEILLGWSVLSENRIAGIRFPEGRLRLGIEGVLELIIEHFAMQWATPMAGGERYYAVALKDCQIKVLGCGFPPDDNELDIYLFPNPVAPLSSRVGWFGGYKFDNEDQFVGLGQRLAIRPDPSQPASCDQVLDLLKDWTDIIGDDPTEEDFRKLAYSRENEWTAALDVEVISGVQLAIVFNDPHLYALRLSVTPPGITIDVVYRKIADDLGLYSTQLRLPDAIRQIEMGAASLTLPVIGLDVYTNGDFRVDLGFPWNVDFQRSFALQIFPFIGKGGIYVGRLNGRTSNLLPDSSSTPANERLKTIAVIGFGLSVGLGKEFEKGIFRFGVSVSLYGILEGALGYRANNGDIFSPNAFCILGRVGILAQLFGTVDFGIIKVSVTILIEVGLPFRIRKLNGPVTFTVPGIEANVSVTAEVVVGRIKIFGKRIEITVSFTFEMHIRLRFPIGEEPQAIMLTGRTPLLRANSADPLHWSRNQFDNLYEVLHV